MEGGAGGFAHRHFGGARLPVIDPLGVLEGGVAGGVFPGASGCVLRPGEPPIHLTAGRLVPGGPVVVPETIYDVASVTKVFTASAALALVARGLLDPNAPVGEIFPPWRDFPVGGATMEQLMCHEAGLAAWSPFFERIPGGERGTAGGRAAILRMVLEHPAPSSPGPAVYSDLGYILLGQLLRVVCDDELGSIIARMVTDPLGLESARFRPVGPFEVLPGGIAATEDCPWRGRTLVGEVHDDNCWAMGGSEGHAGIFASAPDIAALGAAWLESLEGRGWLPEEIAARAVRRRPTGRGFGWDLKSGPGSTAGASASEDTFGHLGFTGCSLWVDPVEGAAVSLLTNRVHPTRENDGIRAVRSAFHDAVFGTRM